MKKIFLPAVFILSFIFFFASKNFINADRSYYVNEYNVQAKINEDGTTQFTEKINYHFDGEYNGIFLNVDYLDCGDFKNYSVCQLKDGNENLFTQSNIGANGNYQLTFENSIAKFKIYSHSYYENKCFVIRYTLTNAVKKFADTAQFNRKLLGQNFETPIKNFNSQISFEHPSNPQDLKIFAHGPLTGESKINDDGTISLQINDLPAYNFIEANALFPTEYVKNFPQTSNEKMLDSIMEQEKNLATQANQIRERARQKVIEEERQSAKQIQWEIKQAALREKWLPIAAIIFLFPIVFSLIYAPIKNKMYYSGSHFDGDYYRELPAQYSPAEMSCLFKNIGSKDIMATLLDLVRRKVLSVEQENRQGLFKEKLDYKITLLDSADLSDLKPHEKSLIDWLIKKIGDGKNVYLSAITKQSKRNPESFTNSYKNWVSETNDFAKEANDFFEPNKNYLCVALIFIFDFLAASILIFILGVDFSVVIPFVIVSVVIIFIFICDTRRNKKAQIEFEKWRAFKKFLKDFSNINSSEIGSIVLWEHYLVYAVSLGVAKQVIKQLPLVFKENDLHSNDLVLVPFFCSSHDSFNHFESLNSQFERSISSARSIANSKNSSISGGGGGFSSGSSGGSGSRGGGGAF